MSDAITDDIKVSDLMGNKLTHSLTIEYYCSVLQGEEASHIAERNDTERSPTLFFQQCYT